MPAESNLSGHDVVVIGASAGGQLVVVSDNPHVRRVIELADVRGLLRVERSLLEGIQYVVDQRLTV